MQRSTLRALLPLAVLPALHAQEAATAWFADLAPLQTRVVPEDGPTPAASLAGALGEWRVWARARDAQGAQRFAGRGRETVQQDHSRTWFLAQLTLPGRPGAATMLLHLNGKGADGRLQGVLMDSGGGRPVRVRGRLEGQDQVLETRGPGGTRLRMATRWLGVDHRLSRLQVLGADGRVRSTLDLEHIRARAVAAPARRDGNDVLGRFEGTWKYRLQVTPPQGEAIVVRGEIRSTRVLGGRHLRHEYRIPASELGPARQARGYLSYDAGRRRFASVGMDSAEPGLRHMTGTWDPDSRALSLRGTHWDPRLQKAIPAREVFRFVSADAYHLERAVQVAQDRWVPVFRAAFHRN